MKKKYVLLLTTMAIVVVSGMSIGYLAGLVFEYEVARFVVIIPSFLAGANARRIAEKFLGYTLNEAMKEDYSG